MTHEKFLAKAGRLANLALTAGAILALGTFVYFFYYYSWTRTRLFGRPVDIVLDYIFPAGLSIALFASLRLKVAHRINVVIVCTACAASAYGVELLLSYFPVSQMDSVMSLLAASTDKTKYAADLTRKFGVDIDTRTATEVLEDLGKNGIDAVPIMTPSNHLFVSKPDGSITSAISLDGQEVIPLAGVSDKVTVLCNENGQWVHYRSDEHGFNNSNDVWHSPYPDIAALGDSYTQGYCVPAEKSFVSIIGQRYSATLNLGVAGDGPLLMLAKLKEYLTVFKPKTVLWFYYEGNDLIDLQRERKSRLLRSYLKDGFTQPSLARQTDIDRAIMDEISKQMASAKAGVKLGRPKRFSSTLMEFLKLSHLRQRLGLVGGMNSSEVESRRDLDGPNMDVFRDILVDAKKRVEGWGGRLYFVYLPEWGRYAGYNSPGITKRNEVLTVVRRVGLPLIDLDPTFRANDNPLSLFPFDAPGHYNEIGHRVVAEEVLRNLAATNAQKHQQ